MTQPTFHVHVRPATPAEINYHRGTWLSHLWSWPFHVCTKIYNICRLVSVPSPLNPLLHTSLKHPFLGNFETFLREWKVTGNPSVMHAILGHHRNDGIHFRTSRTFDHLARVYNEAFLDAQFSSEGLFFTCRPAQSLVFRHVISQLLKGDHDFDALAPQITDEWLKQGRINTFEVGHRLVTRVFCQLVLGLEIPSGSPLTEAILGINQHVIPFIKNKVINWREIFERF